jgi:hypothetical protein
MTVVDGLIKHEYNNPNADDGGPHDHTLNSDWNNGHVLAGGSFDGDVLTWQGANNSKGKFRTIVGSGNISVTVNSTQIVVAFSGSGIIGPASGGTGLDTSASSGIPTVNAGTWVINNVLTNNQVLIAGAANTVKSFAGFTYDGTNFILSTNGNHSFGSGNNSLIQLLIGGTPPAGTQESLRTNPTLAPNVGSNGTMIRVLGTINKQGSGTHVDFAGIQVDAPSIGAGAAVLTNATSLKVVAAPVVGDRQRAFWVASGLSEMTGILAVSGGSGTVHTGLVGIELRGGASPSLTAFNRGTSAYLPMIHDTLGTQFNITGTSMLTIGFATGSALVSFIANTWTGSGQTEMMRAQTTLQSVANANTFGLIFVPNMVEAASGTHGQLTGIYVLPTFTSGAASTTSVIGINIDAIATATIAPTNAVALRLATPSGASNNYLILNDTAGGQVRFDTVGPYSFGTGGVNLQIQMLLQGSFTSNAADVKGFQLNNTLNAGADSGSLIGLFVASTLVERAAGTHPIEAGIYVSPAVTAGAANATTFAGIYVEQISAVAGTTNCAAIFAKGPVGSATNTYGIWTTGNLRVDGFILTTAPNTRTDAGNAYTVGVTDNYLIINKAAIFTLTLPTPSTVTGRALWVQTYTANTVVSASSNVVPKGGGAAGTALLPATQGAWAMIVSDGTNWVIMTSGT